MPISTTCTVVRILSVVACVLALGAPGRAESPHVRLRMAAIAPDGTAWARELKASSREVAMATNGEVELKWYLGAIAGDEAEAIERIRRDQLDGSAGASFCERLAPSLRVLRLPGLVQSRAEGRYVITRLRNVFDEEFKRSGFVELFVEPFGTEVIFSRAPVTTMKDLRESRVWVWSLAETLLRLLRRMGAKIVPLPLEEAGRAYDENRIDVFVSVPTAALAYQLGVRARYFTPLNLALLPGCAVVAQRSFDGMSVEAQRGLRAAMAKMAIRFDDVGKTQDEQLLGGLLEKQGIKRVAVSEAFRAQFLDEARRARQTEPVVAPALVAQVEQWLTEFRAGRRGAGQ
jgi:TRAP-type C4-dicarboxylate transport system substrate-binding protein